MLAALVYADEELRLRVSIPRIDEATMHERAFADVGAHGDVREVELVVPKGPEPEGAALKLCLKEVGPGAGLVDCVVQLASHATVERILRRTPEEEPLPSLSLNVRRGWTRDLRACGRGGFRGGGAWRFVLVLFEKSDPRQSSRTARATSKRKRDAR